MRLPRVRITVWLLMTAGVIVSIVPACGTAPAGLPKTRPDTITTVGTHTILPNKLAVEVYHDRGKINYRLWQMAPEAGQGKTGPEDPPFEKGAKWFIFVESPERFWVFNGRDELELSWIDGPRGGVFSSRVNPEIVNEAPERVRALLPKHFKDKFDIR
jgi:hypothetical protein